MEPDDLWLVAPKDFVGARNALARELRAARRRDEAADVASRRRPSVEDWALNVAAREGGEEGDAFVAAALAAQEAQADAAAGEGAGLRPALDRLRQAEAALTKAAAAVADRLGEGARHRVAIAARLRSVAADAVAVDQLAHGRLGATASPDGDADDVEAPSRAAARPKRPATQPTKAKRPPPPTDASGAAAPPGPTSPTAEERAARRSAERLEALRASAAAAAQGLDAARREVDEVTATIDRRTAAVADAQAEVERTTAALGAAKEELAEAHRSLAKVNQSAARAERVAGRAEADLRKATEG